MADAPRDGWITGIGIVSCLGEGADAHWQGLMEQRLKVDAETFAPYPVHPLAPLDLDQQIPKKGDQRQMEAWQRIGTYAAGLALSDAGLKGNAELLSRMDMIVAAGGGERDVAVDGAILSKRSKAADPGAFLNERLMSDLRPTLFLAQLSNLLAGNISIVHGVTGSSRTFMGEEAAGVDAVRIALARIAAGQSDLALVGGSHNGEREDLLLLYEAGGHMLRGALRRSGSAPSQPAWCSVRLVHFSSWRRASTPRRAAQGRWPGFQPSCRTGRADHPARLQLRWPDVAKPHVTFRLAAHCRDLRCHRSRARYQRRAGLDRNHFRRAGASDWNLAGSRHGAAIRHEHCDCRARAWSQKVVSALGLSGGVEREYEGPIDADRRYRGWSLARRRHGAGRGGEVKEARNGIVARQATAARSWSSPAWA